MKDWYMNHYTPNITNFETDAITEYARSNFEDVLLTEMADDLLLCDHNAKVKKVIRGIIQANLADTQLKSLERIILAPIGTLHGGDYIYFDKNYWIVDGRPGNNKSYEKATMKLCQYKLRWQKDDGTIIERWGNMTTASKYDVGEGYNDTVILSSNNYTILIPHDEDGQTIEDKRVFIDTSGTPHKVYKITRNDDPLFYYGQNGGVLSLIADKAQFNKDTDRPDLLLCDYFDPLDSNDDSLNEYPDKDTQKVFGTISGLDEIKIGFSRNYTVTFVDLKDRELDWKDVHFWWSVECDFEESINKIEDGNKVSLLIDDELLIGSSFILQCHVNNIVVAQKEIMIVDVI